MADAEIWKDIYYVDTLSGEIVDYRGYYQASNLGNIRSVDRTIERSATKRNRTHSVKRNCKILKPGLTRGYHFVVLQKNGISKNYLVHKIVANLFVQNPNNKPYIDHINTIKTDCRASNLRWVTRTENANNPLTKEKREKKVIQYTMDNQYITDYPSAKIAGNSANIFPTSITACCKGKQKSAGGYIWRYAS